MGDELRRQELGRFLRTCRARITPAEVGLPALGRRRTPGLRREEVAQVAGVGLVWYTWLEQGRDIRVSPSVLESVARALMLSPDQTDYLFAMAGYALPPAPVDPGAEQILQRLLDHFELAWGYVHNPRLDMIAASRMMYAVFPYLTDIPMAEHNILRVMFTNPACQALLVNWEVYAQRALAQFRSNWALHTGDPSFKTLLDELMQSSEEFRAWWPQQEVGRRPIGHLRLDHPVVGRLVMERIELKLSAHSDLSLVVNLPLEEAGTAAKFRDLAAATV